MSKKSHPGDGQHGKGTKGMKRPFDDVFAPKKAPTKVEQKPENDEADAQTKTDDE